MIRRTLALLLIAFVTQNLLTDVAQGTMVKRESNIGFPMDPSLLARDTVQIFIELSAKREKGLGSVKASSGSIQLLSKFELMDPVLSSTGSDVKRILFSRVGLVIQKPIEYFYAERLTSAAHLSFINPSHKILRTGAGLSMKSTMRTVPSADSLTVEVADISALQSVGLAHAIMMGSNSVNPTICMVQRAKKFGKILMLIRPLVAISAISCHYPVGSGTTLVATDTISYLGIDDIPIGDLETQFKDEADKTATSIMKLLNSAP